ncbi:hypothetical protein ACA910_008398 [Epithemia clementina (nom. ined.)]
MWPYWKKKGSHEHPAVTNTVDLTGMWLLTAPNMSGKSTLMRSAAASALLSVCGFCAPVGAGSHLHRFGSLFVRGASEDVPSEGKSAFEAEMDEIGAMFRSQDHASSPSLAFVDEVCRGTSPREGTWLAGAIFEAMAGRKWCMTGIFATHLHDIVNLPLSQECLDRTTEMQIPWSESVESTNGFATTEGRYQLTRGICKDSKALETATRCGMDPRITERAKRYYDYLHKTKHDSTDSTQTLCVRPDDENNPVIARSDNNPHRDSVVDLAEKATGKTYDIFVEASYATHPSLSRGQPVLYVLKEPAPEGKYYVGESRNFKERLETHRRRKHKNVVAWVFKASSIDEARDWEEALCTACRRHNLPLSNTRIPRK